MYRPSLYANFVEMIDGIPTIINLFETRNKFFIYINQGDNEYNLFCDHIKKFIESNKYNKGKELYVLCNLNHEKYVLGLKNLLTKMFE